MPNIRKKIYVKKVHLWLTVEQWEKLKENAGKLKLKHIELIRRNIAKEYVYVKYLLILIMLSRKQGNSLNQIAKHCNRTQQAGEEILSTLHRIEALNELILKKVEKVSKRDS